MYTEREIFIKGVGKVVIRKRKGIKRLTIRINQHGEVRMSIPAGVGSKDAERFLKEKTEWIINTRQKILQEKPAVKIYRPQDEIETRYHRVRILAEEEIFEPNCIIKENECLIRIPSRDDYKEEKIQQFIRKGLTETLRKEARQYLVPRVQLLATQYRFSIGHIRVKNLKSRWGSCSVRNNINLNIHLMRVPEYLAEYVIMHELVHTIHKNHGPQFWETLENLFPGSRGYARELKKYRTDF